MAIDEIKTTLETKMDQSIVRFQEQSDQNSHRPS
jgi:hypothetical protein